MQPSAEITAGIEIIGPGKGVVVPHSVVEGRWYQVEEGREIWKLAQVPDDWLYLSALVSNTPATSEGTILTTFEDDQMAREILGFLRKSQYQKLVDDILAGDYVAAGYRSRSEADAALAFMATHHLRHEERVESVLFALLEQNSRKAKSHRNSKRYIETTVRKAITYRERKEKDRLAILKGLLSECLRATPYGGVTDPKDIPVRGKKAALVDAVVAFAAYDGNDGFRRGDGWRRLPVNDIARLFEAHPETVRQARVEAERRELIENDVVCYRHDGKCRRDSLVRFVGAGARAVIR